MAHAALADQLNAIAKLRKKVTKAALERARIEGMDEAMDEDMDVRVASRSLGINSHQTHRFLHGLKLNI